MKLYNMISTTLEISCDYLRLFRRDWYDFFQDRDDSRTKM